MSDFEALMNDRTPRAKIVKDGRTWYAHLSVGMMDVGEVPMAARTRRGIERKARRWIAKEQARQAQREATEFTMTGAEDG